MSNTPIDQLLQITTPTRSSRESSRSGSANADLFRSHLDRAADVAEPKTPKTNNESKTTPTEEEDALETHTGQQETSTAEQEPSAAANESSEPTADAHEEPQTADDLADEVTLSAAAAAQQVETEVDAEQILNAEAIGEAALTDGQQQPEGQTSSELAEASNDSSAAATDSEAVELQAALLGDHAEGETASGDSESRVEAEGETGSAQAALAPETSQTTAAIAVESEVKKSQSSATSTSAQQSLAKQASANEASEALPGSDVVESSSQTGPGRFELPSTTPTNDLAVSVATDAELALANLDQSAESVVSAPSTSTSVSETAVAGRTLGNLMAGKTSAPANSAAETQTNETPTVDRARFVQRVGGAIRAAQNRDGQIQLRLSPPELGTLRINIVMNEGVLTAHLETETAAARNVLLDNLPALRERLAEQDIRIDKFDVNVGQEGQQQTDNPETDDRQPSRSRSQSNQPSSQNNPSLATDESDPTQSVTASGLDVRI